VKTAEFDYDLPETLIAQTPAEPRDSARLMVLDRSTGTLSHRVFHEIGEYLHPGDLLVANESRVIPARLFARKADTGGKVELLLLSHRDQCTWEVLVKGRRTPVGTRIVLERPGEPPEHVAEGKVLAWTDSGGRVIRWDRPIDDLLDELGIVPLPPYVHTTLQDPERYQTALCRRMFTPRCRTPRGTRRSTHARRARLPPQPRACTLRPSCSCRYVARA